MHGIPNAFVTKSKLETTGGNTTCSRWKYDGDMLFFFMVGHAIIPKCN